MEKVPLQLDSLVPQQAAPVLREALGTTCQPSSSGLEALIVLLEESPFAGDDAE